MKELLMRRILFNISEVLNERKDFVAFWTLFFLLGTGRPDDCVDFKLILFILNFLFMGNIYLFFKLKEFFLFP